MEWIAVFIPVIAAGLTVGLVLGILAVITSVHQDWNQ